MKQRSSSRKGYESVARSNNARFGKRSAAQLTDPAWLEVLRRLVEAIENVHGSADYAQVWAVYSVAGVEYRGPTFTRELREAKEFLERNG